jgi:hypothetical protein
LFPARNNLLAERPDFGEAFMYNIALQRFVPLGCGSL